MAQTDSFIALPRTAVAIVPMLMLPILIGAGWLIVSPHSMTGRSAIIIGAIAVGLYLLGGLIAARHLIAAFRARRGLPRLAADAATIPDPAWICDADGRIKAQNAPALQGFGDLEGDNILSVLSRFRADAGQDIDRLLRRAERRGLAEYALDDKRLLGAQRDRWAGLTQWTISPLAGAEKDAAAGGDAGKTTEGFDILPVALLLLDGAGYIQRANPAAERLLGQLEGKPHLGGLLDGPGRPVGDWVGDVANGRQGGRAEMLRLRRDDQEVHFQVTLIRDPSTRNSVIAVLSDASALKTLEAQFVQSQKMQAIGQLAGGVAHDFNNLLTAISGHCDLLMLRRDKSDPDYADLDQISQNANRAAALVGQLLAFSRKQTLKPSIVDMRDTLADLTHLLNRLVGERVSLSIIHDPALQPIRADKRQLEQVIMNLVVNARDAMSGGGDIVIRTSNLHLENPLSRNRATLPVGDYVCIEVQDEGIGIPEDHLDKIFEPFFTTKRTGEGTGLGLSTAYGIIKQTGGYIFCDSAMGKGTCFRIYFPAYQGEADLDAAPDPADQPARSEISRSTPATVLLVEDEAAVRAFATRALELQGYEVLQASNAEAALELLSDSRLQIDIFVTDVVMPGMDGPSWVRTALRARPQTRVIFVSGYSEDIFVEGHAPVPNSIFLAKPFTLSELTETVARHLASG